MRITNPRIEALNKFFADVETGKRKAWMISQDSPEVSRALAEQRILLQWLRDGARPERGMHRKANVRIATLGGSFYAQIYYTHPKGDLHIFPSHLAPVVEQLEEMEAVIGLIAARYVS